MRRQNEGLDGLQPYYISDAEADRLLGSPPGPALPDPETLARQARLVIAAELEALETSLAEAESRRLEQGGPALRLARLVDLFGLTAFDRDVVLVCLAPELDERYARLYAYLQDDLRRRLPTMGLIFDLLCPGAADRLAAEARLSPAAPLRRHALVRCIPGPGVSEMLFRDQVLCLDERVRRFLLGQDDLDERLGALASLGQAGIGPQELPLPQDFIRDLEAVIQTDRAQALYFQGPPGVGRREAAAHLAAGAGFRLLVVHLDRLLTRPQAEIPTRIMLAGREALLQQAILFLPDFELLFAPEQRGVFELVCAALDELPRCSILSGASPWAGGLPFRRAGLTAITFPSPDAQTRLQLWAGRLNGQAAGVDLLELAQRYRLTPGQIAAAVDAAPGLARGRDPVSGRLETGDLAAAARMQLHASLPLFAQRIHPHYTWQDIVLPPESLSRLSELSDQVRLRARVLEDWGFDRKLALGKGLGALFSGPPGTGKTMAADILAGALGFDLYKIDLSGVVSKYIGETEKNLARLFAEAAAGQVILFFDEADALFGKRTEVKDAHDRYANQEVSYLLQKMDEFEGIVILATNLRQNMDQAFLRRLQFIIEFPFPAAAERLRIWRGIWPDEVPLASDLDLETLAEQLELPGGNIRNIALSAAYLAAAADERLGMAHLLQAAESETKKIGKWTSSGALAALRERLAIQTAWGKGAP